LKSEDDIPCSMRLGALVGITLLYFLWCCSAQALEVRILDGGLLVGTERGKLVTAFQEAAEEIHFLCGLSTSFFVEVIVYPSYRSFRKRGFPYWAGGGFLDGKIHLPVFSPSPSGTDLRRIVGHELFHAAVWHAGIALPTWLEEGVAEYFFPTHFPENEDQHNLPSGISHTFLDQQHALLFYQKAKDVVTRLCEAAGDQAIKEFFTMLEYIPLEEAFFQSFGLEIEEAWNSEFTEEVRP